MAGSAVATVLPLPSIDFSTPASATMLPYQTASIVSNVVEALKYVYGAERLEKALNEKSITWSLFKKQEDAAAGGVGFLVSDP